MRAPVVAAALLGASGLSTAATPSDFAALVIARYQALPQNAGLKMMTLPDYGPSICLSAMYECGEVFGNSSWPSWASAIASAYAADPASNAWAVLHNKTVPWGYSVGDDMGLFPIVYLARALAGRVPYGVGDDWALASGVAEGYVLGWPLRLPDASRTISRAASWGTEPTNNSSLWDDDLFMGVALLSRMARAPGAPAAVAQKYANFLAEQHVAFAHYLQDGASGLYKHGYNHATGDLSCCAWGRANGWVMMSHAETAEALAAVDAAHPALPAVLAIWRAHAAGLARVQAPGDGRFHQVLDVPSTFLETSCTAMTLYSLATGVRRGWLDRATFAPVIDAAWAGLNKAVDADGTVTGICEGTGIGTSVAFYEARATAYNVSAPGLGSVFRAAAAYALYLAA